jgi:hypothetical protein
MLTYRLIHALLDDDHGISSEAYDALINWLACHKDGSLQLAERITDVAEATDGRWYIPEETDLRSRLLPPDALGVK